MGDEHSPPDAQPQRVLSVGNQPSVSTQQDSTSASSPGPSSASATVSPKTKCSEPSCRAAFFTELDDHQMCGRHAAQCVDWVLEAFIPEQCKVCCKLDAMYEYKEVHGSVPPHDFDPRRRLMRRWRKIRESCPAVKWPSCPMHGLGRIYSAVGWQHDMATVDGKPSLKSSAEVSNMQLQTEVIPSGLDLAHLQSFVADSWLSLEKDSSPAKGAAAPKNVSINVSLKQDVVPHLNDYFLHSTTSHIPVEQDVGLPEPPAAKVKKEAKDRKEAWDVWSAFVNLHAMADVANRWGQDQDPLTPSLQDLQDFGLVFTTLAECTFPAVRTAVMECLRDEMELRKGSLQKLKEFDAFRPGLLWVNPFSGVAPARKALPKKTQARPQDPPATRARPQQGLGERRLHPFAVSEPVLLVRLAQATTPATAAGARATMVAVPTVTRIQGRLQGWADRWVDSPWPFQLILLGLAWEWSPHPPGLASDRPGQPLTPRFETPVAALIEKNVVEKVGPLERVFSSHLFTVPKRESDKFKMCSMAQVRTTSI